MAPATRIELVEVAPRDGLQHEARSLSLALRRQLIERLIACGHRRIEIGSFVSASAIPQLVDTASLLQTLPHPEGVRFSALVPNQRGLRDALSVPGLDEIAVFTSASESFCQHNIHCSITESLERFAPVIASARARGLRVRGYLSCVLGCPFEGAVPPAQVAAVARALWKLGIDELSLGDTIGVGTPLAACRMLEAVACDIPLPQLAAHLHNSYGMALANLYALLQEGIRVVDCAVGGLGGCPFAPGASGNLATEEVVYLLEGMGIDCGLSLDALIRTGHWISLALGHPSRSAVGQARPI